MKRTPLRAMSAKREARAKREGWFGQLIRRVKALRKRGDQAKREAKFERNFRSVGYVVWTKQQPCIFCNSVREVRTAHVLQARGMGGAGGDWTATGPVCGTCDVIWDGVNGGRETLLRLRGMTWEQVRAKVVEHQTRYLTQMGTAA